MLLTSCIQISPSHSPCTIFIHTSPPHCLHLGFTIAITLTLTLTLTFTFTLILTSTFTLTFTLTLTSTFTLTFTLITLQMVIGVGWNWSFVSATSSLVKQTRPAERARAQAANDILVFTASGTVSVLSAVVFRSVGWRAMQIAAWAAGGAILLIVLISEGCARRALTAASAQTTAVATTEVILTLENREAEEQADART